MQFLSNYQQHFSQNLEQNFLKISVETQDSNNQSNPEKEKWS